MISSRTSRRLSGNARGSAAVCGEGRLPGEDHCRVDGAGEEAAGKLNFGYGSSSRGNGWELYKLLAGLDLSGRAVSKPILR